MFGASHVGDRRACGSNPKPFDKCFDPGWFTARQYLDAAVGEIARVTGHLEFAGTCLRAAPVVDTLDASADPTDSAYHWAGAPNRAVRSRGASSIIQRSARRSGAGREAVRVSL